VANVAAEAGAASSERSRLRIGSKTTVAAAGSSMTWMSSMRRMVSLTTFIVKGIQASFLPSSRNVPACVGGGHRHATAVAQDSQFLALPTVPITWQSLYTGILTTTNQGFITAVGVGITILRLTAGNVSYDQTVTVNP